MATKKNIVDSINILLTKFVPTDDSRLDDDWMSYKIDQVAADLKIKQYQATGIVDPQWVSPSFTLSFHRVNWADDPSVTCKCDVSKATIPTIISFNSNEGNVDLGIYSLSSMCGTKLLSLRRMTQWKYTPPEHTYSLFKFYDRKINSLYVNYEVDKLMLAAILLNPEDGYLKNSDTIASGSIVSGTVYLVKYGTVVYDGGVYNVNTTFTGTAVATYTGTGSVYLNSQLRSYYDTDPYPASGEMIRMIELEILTKEFGIERQIVDDKLNDSTDDSKKG